jgi:3-oxoacyl-[acyl-carrier protein] reductase
MCTTPYAATKAAVIALTKRLAFELSPYGINVNCVCPGFTITDATTVGDPPQVAAFLNAMKGKTMLGRNGNPEEIAYAILFLASDESSFITAQSLCVDGGRMDCLSYSM